MARFIYAEPSVTLSQVPSWLGGLAPKPGLKIDTEDYFTSPAVAGMGQSMAEAEMQCKAVRQFEVGGHEHLVRLTAWRFWA